MEHDVLLGTGEGLNYIDYQLNGLNGQNGDKVHLFRALCEAEYMSVCNNGNVFVPYEYAMDKKWFATCRDHAVKWGEWFYPDGNYKVVEIVVLRESLKFMFYLKSLDNIGPAYAADTILLNKIVRRLTLV